MRGNAPLSLLMGLGSGVGAVTGGGRWTNGDRQGDICKHVIDNTAE